jgi:hypothetical protein
MILVLYFAPSSVGAELVGLPVVLNTLTVWPENANPYEYGTLWSLNRYWHHIGPPTLRRTMSSLSGPV